jgi:hypothetical protein
MTDFGSWAELSLLGLYTMTLIRPDTPTQSPLVALSDCGTLASVAVLTLVRVLGVDDIRWRAVAFLLDLGGEYIFVVVVYPDLDAGLFGERRNHGVGRLLVLGVVEREGWARGSRRGCRPTTTCQSEAGD